MLMNHASAVNAHTQYLMPAERNLVAIYVKKGGGGDK
jgi:hypothetical protein